VRNDLLYPKKLGLSRWHHSSGSFIASLNARRILHLCCLWTVPYSQIRARYNSSRRGQHLCQKQVQDSGESSACGRFMSCMAFSAQMLRMREIHPEKFCNQSWTGGGFGVEDEQGWNGVHGHRSAFLPGSIRFGKGVYYQNWETFGGNIAEIGCRRPNSLRSNWEVASYAPYFVVRTKAPIQRIIDMDPLPKKKKKKKKIRALVDFHHLRAFITWFRRKLRGQKTIWEDEFRGVLGFGSLENTDFRGERRRVDRNFPRWDGEWTWRKSLTEAVEQTGLWNQD